MAKPADTPERPEHDAARRQFLRNGLGAAALLTIAPGVLLWRSAAARSQDQPVSSSVRWGMLIDTNRCTVDCNACVTACNTWNGLYGHGRPATDSQWIRKLQVRDPRSGHVTFVPMMCQHCEDPPCADVCPTGASFRRADGIVLVDKHICIGCRYCMMACPYKARSFVAEDLTDQKPYAPRGKGTVEACTLCVTRVDAGRLPACAEACGEHGNGALLFGDLNNPKSEIAQRIKKYGARQIRADLGLNTGIHYRGI